MATNIATRIYMMSASQNMNQRLIVFAFSCEKYTWKQRGTKGRTCPLTVETLNGKITSSRWEFTTGWLNHTRVDVTKGGRLGLYAPLRPEARLGPADLSSPDSGSASLTPDTCSRSRRANASLQRRHGSQLVGTHALPVRLNHPTPLHQKWRSIL